MDSIYHQISIVHRSTNPPEFPFKYLCFMVFCTS